MISTIILAAGQSKRMGQPKMPLPWVDGTVLGHIINVFRATGMQDILIITGGARQAVESIAQTSQARTIFNQEYARGEMLSSLQVGLRALGPETEAALVALGDQPQVQEKTIRLIVDTYARTAAPLIVPSYQMHRGHPWLVTRQHWAEILGLDAPETPRDFLNRHATEIQYVEVDSSTILEDLDTMDDYARANPRASN
jgi:molybdenum cofactor cytidylyltransferase